LGNIFLAFDELRYAQIFSKLKFTLFIKSKQFLFLVPFDATAAYIKHFLKNLIFTFFKSPDISIKEQKQVILKRKSYISILPLFITLLLLQLFTIDFVAVRSIRVAISALMGMVYFLS